MTDGMCAFARHQTTTVFISVGCVYDLWDEFWQLVDLKSKKVKLIKVKAHCELEDVKQGKITFKDLKKICKELGENLTDEEIQGMLDHADKSNLGYVNMDDFYRLMKKKTNANNIDDLLGDEE